MSQKPVSAESMLFNVGAETGVLGGLMLDNDRWDEIAPLLIPEIFNMASITSFSGRSSVWSVP
ncbi:hypothetical protein, partial [Salmonella enterica]|uniref:hypothetical protein n=1 Tax=Salmonella enterica TaxID=28901 RepID=UPI0021B2F7DE